MKTQNAKKIDLTPGPRSKQGAYCKKLVNRPALARGVVTQTPEMLKE